MKLNNFKFKIKINNLIQIVNVICSCNSLTVADIFI